MDVLMSDEYNLFTCIHLYKDFNTHTCMHAQPALTHMHAETCVRERTRTHTHHRNFY